MRKVLNLNENWAFTKNSNSTPTKIEKDYKTVNLPHTWNAIDGTDGGNDYYRGLCYYLKQLKKSELPKSDRYFIEIKGANSSATLYLNGEKLACHDGGYSTWRVDITEKMKDDNLLVIGVDNSPNDRVYPQMADFTFYGGLYRDVNLICVSETHFDLEYYGSSGVMVTPTVIGSDAEVEIEVFIKGKRDNLSLKYTVLDEKGNEVAKTVSKKLIERLKIPSVNLWQGSKNPYLYTAVIELISDDKVLDAVKTNFGCRTFEVDPDRGFILNNEEYPLRGVSRHQDRKGYGNALTKEHHKEDIDLICEVGANTVRLAHYQHDDYFYELCDRKGLVVWAEIPYISKHIAIARENTISQMKELIIQNYNHPSIVVWGLSNEITMSGDKDPDLLENHRILNELVKELDKTRKTAIACLTMCPTDSPILEIPDLISYNHYFGWYGGDTDMNGPWFDRFHKLHPQIPIGCSEYGCEALNWHSSNPIQGDYTEEYQAHYHEELIKQLFARKYIWATHVWNMFDFGADARAEGGENGQNHKGLVTFDRKYKKDAFYAYKAWLSDEPFVHICSKRYVDRAEDMTSVTVYSNQPEVELFVNQNSIGKKKAEDHFFYFEVPLTEDVQLKAVAGNCQDTSEVRKVKEFNEDYRLKEAGAVLNWFDIEAPEGYFSLNDKVSDIIGTVKGKLLFASLAKNLTKGMDKNKTSGFDITADMMKMMEGFTVLRLTTLMGAANLNFTKEDLLELNSKLNKIKKPKSNR